MVDYNYETKMERLNISSFDFLTNKWTYSVIWKDYVHVSTRVHGHCTFTRARVSKGIKIKQWTNTSCT